MSILKKIAKILFLQKIILYLDSDPLLRDPDNRKIVLNMLKGKIFKQNDLFDYNAQRQLFKLADVLYPKYLVKEDKSKDIYFIRTSYEDTSEEELWKIYNSIRKVESTFRVLKSDLNMHPVHHQKDDRIESHIYLTILAYQLINTIRLMLKRSGINYGWENIVRIMSTQKIVTMKLPIKTKAIHQRRPTKPIKEAKRIYDAAGCIDTQKVLKKYVVYH